MKLRTQIAAGLGTLGLLFAATDAVVICKAQRQGPELAYMRQQAAMVNDHGADLLAAVLAVKFDVSEVQQFLSTISATRALNGYDTGLAEAENFARQFDRDTETGIFHAQAVHADEVAAALRAARVQFPSYYEEGKKMAKAYVDGGPKAGNPLMRPFDLKDKALDQVLDAAEAKTHKAITRVMGDLVEQADFAAGSNEMMLRTIWIAALSGFGLASAIGTSLFIRVRGQFRKLDQDVHQVLAKQYDRPLRLKEDQPNEFGPIARALSELVAGSAGIEARTAELRDLIRVVDAHAIVSMADVSGRITHVNDHFCALSGYSREELIGQNHRMLKSDRHPPETYAELWRVITSGGIWRGILCNRTKDGSEYWVQSTIAPALDQKGRRCGYISIRTDITDVVGDREQLSELGRALVIFQKIFETTNEAVDVMSPEGSIVYTNPARERLIGEPMEQASGEHFSALVPKAGAKLIEEVQAGIASGRGWRGNLPFQKADGSVFVAACNFEVIADGAGKPQHVFNIFRDITPELSRMTELRTAREAADVANRAKSEFLSNMSHELRTPLNAVIGFAQLLLTSKTNRLNERQTVQVQHIRKGGEYLLHLIGEILEFAKIEAGGLSLSIETVSLRELIDECIDLAGPLLTKYDVTLIDEAGADTPKLRVDHVRAKQVILNLLSNAAKYNRQGGTIRLTGVVLDTGYVRVGVADTGIGIEEAKQAELFQPFNRLGAERTEVEGSGIGLVLTRKLVEAMEGRIDFESTPGEGSRFWVDFPQADDEAIATADGPHEEDSHAENGNIGGAERLMLYIEDNPMNIALMEDIVEEMSGWKLIVTYTAELGLPLVESRCPDIVICDINLPGMGGIEAVKHLKMNENTRHIPVLALSADAASGTISRGLAAGFAAYLTKPVRLHDLGAALDKALEDADAQSSR